MFDIKLFLGSRKRGCDATCFKREKKQIACVKTRKFCVTEKKAPQFFILIIHNKMRKRSFDRNK